MLTKHNFVCSTLLDDRRGLDLSIHANTTIDEADEA
jgi:hypothetical protein